MASTNQFLHLLFLALFMASQATSRPLDPKTVSPMTMRERHEQWIARHGRVYESTVEKEERFHIFKENVKRIEAFNGDGASNKSYKLGANAFADLTNEEFVATHTGNIIGQFQSQTNNTSSVASMFSYDTLGDVGSSVDWRQQGAVTPVKNQLDCRCCWAFSSVAALEGAYQIQTGNLVSFSEQELVDCVQASNGCGGGRMTDVFQYLESQGIDTEDEYPYMVSQGQCNASPSSVTISGYQQVPPNDVNALMAAVNQQPVSIAIDDMGFNGQLYSGGVYTGGCGTNLNHAVTVIGYGTDDVSGMNYWLIKNSWGENWGENGYMRLLMDESLCPITLGASFPLL